MWEKTKTYLLVFLILLSLIMSYHLWFGTPNYEAITLPSFERIPPGETSSAVNLLLPENITFFPEQPSSASPTDSLPEEESAEEELAEQEPGEQASVDEEIDEKTDMEEETENSDSLISRQGEGEQVEEFPPSGEEEKAPDNKDILEKGVYMFAPFQQDYMLLWEAFTQLLNRVETVSLAPGSQEEVQARMEERKEPYLEISFTAPFDAELFFPSRVRITETQEFPLIQNVYLFWGEEPQAFFRTSQGNLFQVSWNINLSPLFNLLKQLAEEGEPDHFVLSELGGTAPFSLEKQLILEEVLVPKQVPSLPDFSFSREPAEKEALAKAFFVDLSLVRQIKERDEAIIFTDGQKGLRISSQGMIEYTAPLQRDAGKRLSYREALDIGADYVNLYVELPEEIHLRISDLTPVILDNKEYYQMKLRSYYEGLVLDPETFTLELTYDQQGLVSYTCQSYTISQREEEPVEVDVKGALSQVLFGLPEIFHQQDPRRITGAYLVYKAGPRFSEEFLQPFWNIEIDGSHEVIVNARSGELSQMKDLK